MATSQINVVVMMIIVQVCEYTRIVLYYKLPCKDCDLAYIGETGKSLKNQNETTRIKLQESL